MKNKFKFLILIITLCLILIPETKIHASEIHDYNKNILNTNQYILDVDGETLIFDSLDDLQTYVYLTSITKAPCLPGDPYYPTCQGDTGGSTKTVFLYSKDKNNVFLGYHTKYWDNVQSYTVSKSMGLDFHISTVSIKFNDSIGKTYGADQNRQSKLAAYGDFREDYYEMQFIRNGQIEKRSRYHKTITKNLYSKVVYR